MDVKSILIDNIGLSKRSQNALHRAKIHTVGDMLCHTEESLSNIRNLGSKSIDEILSMIEKYKEFDENSFFSEQQETLKDPENFKRWMNESSGRDFVLSWLDDKKIDELELLSAKTYNLLMLNGYDLLRQIVFMDEEDFLTIPRMDSDSSREIVILCAHYLQEHSVIILESYKKKQSGNHGISDISVFQILNMPEYHDAIKKFVRVNDRDLQQLSLSARPYNRLLKNDIHKLSDFIFKTEAELYRIPGMGPETVKEIMSKINEYLSLNEDRIRAVCEGNEAVLIDDATICNSILDQYKDIGFGGLSLNELTDRLELPECVSEERLKGIIGSLLTSNELEYVDFRCYRVYDKFEDCLNKCDLINDRNKDLIHKRLEGITLEGIAKDYGLTRERVRQIVKNDVQKLREWYKMKTGKAWFDEDYFCYFYETYDLEKRDSGKWFGMPASIFNYMDMMDIKPGKKELQYALEDSQNLDAGLRLKVKNYLNRNKLFIGGIWIEKRRADIEELVVREYCKEDVHFSDYVKIFNEFLEREGIEFDEDIYYTESIIRSRKNRMKEARFLLWKQNEKIRYYDIDGRDFTELLDVLNLEAYENIELSTLKFVENYPEILNKYDIHDQYELHNLLRKIVPEGSYNDFRCGRMPEIIFGTFDRDAAILDILIDYAPVSTEKLCNLVHEEYGYDIALIQSTYLKSFTAYCHQGVYSIDQKLMPLDRRKELKKALNEDFYFIEEIRGIYRSLFQDADLEEINPYNLKLMGFNVLSRYVIQNYSSVEDYFEDILTKEDIADITHYRKRYAYVPLFSSKLMSLKRNMQVVEFEPNHIINVRKLEKSGVSKEDIDDFCDKVFDFVTDDDYFSVQSIKSDGFESELFNLGFSDWFYANLLISDERFSFGKMFGNIILYKGNKNITIQSFEMSCINKYDSLDVFDLMTELIDHFGCKIIDRYDVIYKIRGSKIYHDKILDRLYSSVEVYYRELDDMGELI